MSNIIENILQFHAYKYNLSLLIVFLVFFKLNLFKLELFSFFIISNFLLFQIKGLFQYSRTSFKLSENCMLSQFDYTVQ